MDHRARCQCGPHKLNVLVRQRSGFLPPQAWAIGIFHARAAQKNPQQCRGKSSHSRVRGGRFDALIMGAAVCSCAMCSDEWHARWTKGAYSLHRQRNAGGSRSSHGLLDNYQPFHQSGCWAFCMTRLVLCQKVGAACRRHSFDISPRAVHLIAPGISAARA